MSNSAHGLDDRSVADGVAVGAIYSEGRHTNHNEFRVRFVERVEIQPQMGKYMS